METSCARCIEGNESASRGIADHLRICYYQGYQKDELYIPTP